MKFKKKAQFSIGVLKLDNFIKKIPRKYQDMFL